jgi:hypothetical protein
MKSLHRATGRDLVWQSRRLFSPVHDLLDASGLDSEPYATLTLRNPLVVSPGARCETGEGTWEFRHRSFHRESVIVHAEGSEVEAASFQRSWRRGTIRFQDGREFVWRPGSFWGLEWRIEDSRQIPLLRFRKRFSLRTTYHLEIDPAADSLAELSCLAGLGYYLLVLSRRRRAARWG